MSDEISRGEMGRMIKDTPRNEISLDGVRNHLSKRNIKTYDFTRPSKFSKEQLRALEVIFESYARLVGNYLSGHLRSLTNVEVVGSEALTYQEFTSSLSNPAVLSSIDFEPLDGSIIIEAGTSLCFGIIERLLGGAGNSLDKSRGFTDIENLIITKIFSKLTSLLVEPWSNVISLEPKFNRMETNSQISQLVSPNEMVALISFRISIGDLAGIMNICIPHLVIKPVLDKISTRYWFTTKDNSVDKPYSKDISSMMNTTDMPISVTLGKASITIEEFLGLQEGDVIKLDSKVNSELDVYVANLLKFKGIPGSNKNRAAVKITAKVERDEE